jgi:hypothetical protein
MPLVGAYLAILYAYIVRIALIREWPEDGVAWLILWFLLIAMVAYIFSYPLMRDRVNRFYWWLQRWLFAFIIPLTLLLFVAIGVRINQYGFTENRYFVFLFGVWLLGISLYGLFSKRRNIIVFVSSFFILMLLSLVGPWSAFSISKQSQLNRLDEIIAAGHPHKGANSVIEYLIRNHGLGSLVGIVDLEQDKIADMYSYDQANAILDQLGIEDGREQLRPRREPEYQPQMFHLYLDGDNAVHDIKGFEYLVEIEYWSGNSQKHSFMHNDKEYVVGFDGAIISLNSGSAILASLNLEEVRQNLEKDEPEAADRDRYYEKKADFSDMRFDIEGDGLAMQVRFYDLRFQYSEAENVTADVLIDFADA